MNYFRMFRPPSESAKNFLFYSDGLGHLKDETFHIDRVGYDNNLVMYVLSGVLHVEQNGHFKLHQNQGIIMRLMDKHKYYTDSNDICEILWIHFNGKQSEDLLKIIDKTKGMPAVFKDGKIEGLIKHCFTLVQEDSNEREFLMSQTIYNIIISILYSTCKKNVYTIPNAKTEFMKQISAYIDRNIYGRITLQELADEFNMSSYHFCRVFERHFNITPIKYVLMKKTEMAKYLLAYTHEPISNIAGSLSFVDQSHFSKTFKRFQGISPHAFRQGNYQANGG